MKLDGYGQNGDGYEYEASDIEVRQALQDIMADHLKLRGDESRAVVDFLIDEIGVETDLQEGMREEITAYFKDEIDEYVKDCEEADRDPLGYVGMKERDFL